MTLPVQAGITALGASEDARRAGGPLQDRLGEVQTLLAGDLASVEEELRQAAEQGRPSGTDAARHLVTRGGKRIRPMALLTSAACFGPIDDAIRQAAVVVELVHSATLLHDDVIDEGDTRRGAPAPRRLWGNAVSVLAGDLLLVNALERTADRCPSVLARLLRTLRQLVDGEIVQLRGRTSLDVTEATYQQILEDKTASLFGWATWAGARLAGADATQQEQMARFGERLGVAFQLVDDAIDYVGTDTGKTLHADLREGKVTLPLVLAVQRDATLAGALAELHRDAGADIQSISRAVEQSGAVEETRRRAEAATAEALSALDAIPDSRWRQLLEAVATELVRREA